MDIKTFLYIKNLTQAEFAKAVGISPYALCNYIAKRRTPTLDIATRIFQASHGMITFKDLNFKKPKKAFK
jgi:transcriptional regulator with XRE-family HTH domain